jgi:hypothetical protein
MVDGGARDPFAVEADTEGSDVKRLVPVECGREIHCAKSGRAGSSGRVAQRTPSGPYQGM